MKPAAFAYHAAAASGDALAVMAEHAAKPFTGSQSLGPMLNLRLVRPAMLVDLSRAADLRGVTDLGDAILYGAAITHAEMEDGIVCDATPGWLAAAAHGIAYRAVRNRGTIGGSLAHADPAADWVVVMTALGASVRLAGQGGTREVPLSSFFVGPFATALEPDEIITGIVVKKRAAPARWAYWKYCRKVGEFAKASAAVLVDLARGETRILLGAIERPPALVMEPDAVLAGAQTPLDAVRAAVPDLDNEATQLHAAALARAIAALRDQG